jgi:hypothetical protein
LPQAQIQYPESRKPKAESRKPKAESRKPKAEKYSLARPPGRADNGAEVGAMMHTPSQTASGFGRPWLALTVAFALHVLDEATTGFLNIYNPTVTAMRVRFVWFPMPTFEFRVWLVGLIVGVALCFALTPVAARNSRWLRPLAWLYALIMFFNGIGHTAVTILGRTVTSVSVPRPAPGFYSSPLLFIGSVWLMMRLWNTASGVRLPSSAPEARLSS